MYGACRLPNDVVSLLGGGGYRCVYLLALLPKNIDMLYSTLQICLIAMKTIEVLRICTFALAAKQVCAVHVYVASTFPILIGM